jgi:choline monooxygenase
MSRYYVDPDIAKASTLPSDFYTNPGMFEICKEKIFSVSWQFIGSSELVSNPGDAYPFLLFENFLNEPLVLVKNANNSIHLLSNVCTHRGNLVVNVPCRLTNLRCRYHGRLFRPDGKFISMPEFKEVINFPTLSDDLRQLPIYQWGNWLFSSLNPTIDPESGLRDMIDRVGWLPVNEFIFKPELSTSFIVGAHWALYCENYLEGFHIPFVHAGLNDVLNFGDYTTELFAYSSLQLGMAKNEEDCFEIPNTCPDFGKKIAAFYFFVFPNMMFNFYPWGLSVNIITPISLEQTKVSFYTYIWKESKYNTGAGSGLDSVELEDEEVVESVQKGIRSRFYQHGRYSVNREQGTHHFHRILASIL